MWIFALQFFLFYSCVLQTSKFYVLLLLQRIAQFLWSVSERSRETIFWNLFSDAVFMGKAVFSYPNTFKHCIIVMCLETIMYITLSVCNMYSRDIIGKFHELAETCFFSGYRWIKRELSNFAQWYQNLWVLAVHTSFCDHGLF